MLPSIQLCSAVTASEDVSAGTHTRVTSDLKGCLWMHLFMLFKCCKSKGHPGKPGDWQTSCHSDEYIVLCVARTARGKEEGGTQGSFPRRAEAPADKKSEFPGWGQAGVLMIPHQWPGGSTGHPLFRHQHYIPAQSFSFFPTLSRLLIQVPTVWQTDRLVIGSRDIRASD